jgi:hypothetical protein
MSINERALTQVYMSGPSIVIYQSKRVRIMGRMFPYLQRIRTRRLWEWRSIVMDKKKEMSKVRCYTFPKLGHYASQCSSKKKKNEMP